MTTLSHLAVVITVWPMARLPWLAIYSAKEKVGNLMPGVQFMPYLHEYRCPLGLGEAGVDALTYYFENFIEDVESARARWRIKPAWSSSAISRGRRCRARPKMAIKNPWSDRKHDIVLILDGVKLVCALRQKCLLWTCRHRAWRGGDGKAVGVVCHYV